MAEIDDYWDANYCRT